MRAVLPVLLLSGVVWSQSAPEYPGARAVPYAEIAEEMGCKSSELSTPDEFEKVLAFYEARLKQKTARTGSKSLDVKAKTGRIEFSDGSSQTKAGFAWVPGQRATRISLQSCSLVKPTLTAEAAAAFEREMGWPPYPKRSNLDAETVGETIVVRFEVADPPEQVVSFYVGHVSPPAGVVLENTSSKERTGELILVNEVKEVRLSVNVSDRNGRSLVILGSQPHRLAASKSTAVPAKRPNQIGTDIFGNPVYAPGNTDR